jgi:redox-sensitive bicupin YhaK (pirin superfamily)
MRRSVAKSKDERLEGMESWIQVPLSDRFMSDWKERFEQAKRAFHELKGLTKKIPASEWTPEYREAR